MSDLVRALPSSTRRAGAVGDFFDPARKGLTAEQLYAENQQRMNSFTPAGMESVAWRAVNAAPPDLLPAFHALQWAHRPAAITIEGAR